MSQKINEFQTRINNIVTDLLNEGTYADFMSLQTNKTCNAHTIFLEQELQGLKKVELAEFETTVLIAENKSIPCTTEKCENVTEELNKKRYSMAGKSKSKKQICESIAIYYVRVFNLLAALMVGLDPHENMCNKRILSLYKKVQDMEGEVQVTVCDSNDKLYPKDIMEIKGLSELLALYQQYNIEGMESYNQSLKDELVKLTERMDEVFKTKISGAENSGQIPNNEGVNNMNNEGIELEEETPPNTEIEQVKQKLNNTLAKNNKRTKKNNNRGRNNATPKPEVPEPTKIEPPNPITTTVESKPPPMTQLQGPPTPPNIDNIPGLPTGKMEINASSSNNSEQNGGSKRTKKKIMRGGAGFFDGLMNMIKGPPSEESPTVFSTSGQSGVTVQPSKVDIAREETKTLSEFRKFMEETRSKGSGNIYVKGSQVKLSGKVEDFSKSKECAKGDLNRNVKLASPAYTEFRQNMVDIRKHYEKSNKDIDGLLTKLVNNDSGKYKLRQVSADGLLELEKNSREVLLNHYTKCQEYFKTGFSKLILGIGQEELLKKKKH